MRSNPAAINIPGLPRRPGRPRIKSGATATRAPRNDASNYPGRAASPMAPAGVVRIFSLVNTIQYIFDISATVHDTNDSHNICFLICDIKYRKGSCIFPPQSTRTPRLFSMERITFRSLLNIVNRIHQLVCCAPCCIRSKQSIRNIFMDISYVQLCLFRYICVPETHRL